MTDSLTTINDFNGISDGVVTSSEATKMSTILYGKLAGYGCIVVSRSSHLRCPSYPAH